MEGSQPSRHEQRSGVAGAVQVSSDSLFRRERTARDAIFLQECEHFDDLLTTIENTLPTAHQQRDNVAFHAQHAMIEHGGEKTHAQLRAYRDVCRSIASELAVASIDPLLPVRGDTAALRHHRARRPIVSQSISYPEASPQREHVSQLADSVVEQHSTVGRSGRWLEQEYGAKESGEQGGNTRRGDGMSEEDEWRWLQKQCDALYGPLAMDADEAQRIMERVVGLPRPFL